MCFSLLYYCYKIQCWFNLIVSCTVLLSCILYICALQFMMSRPTSLFQSIDGTQPHDWCAWDTYSNLQLYMGSKYVYVSGYISVILPTFYITVDCKVCILYIQCTVTTALQKTLTKNYWYNSLKVLSTCVSWEPLSMYSICFL